MPRPKSTEALTATEHTEKHRRKLLAAGGMRADIKLGPEEADKARRLMNERGLKITGLVAQLIRDAPEPAGPV